MHEQIWEKLKDGLRQYCRQNNFQNVILGLSGGIDSALTAVLAADALGGQNGFLILINCNITSWT